MSSGMVQQFSSEKANSSAKVIQRQAGAAKDAFSNVEKEINAMSSWWQGETSAAFGERFGELKPSLIKLYELMDEVGEQLKKVALVKEQAERDIASKIKM